MLRRTYSGLLFAPLKPSILASSRVLPARAFHHTTPRCAMPLQNYVFYAIGGIGASFVAGLYAFQEKLLYHPSIPTRDYENTPDDWNMPYRDVNFVASDGTKLHAWLITQAQSPRSAATFIYFHGNAGNIGHRLQDVKDWYARGYNLFMVSYRGYGTSDGEPSEKGILMDADAAVSYLSEQEDVVNRERIYLFGRSIGGAVAMAAASGKYANKIRGMVIENSFTSIDDMIDVVLPPLRFFKFLNRNKWNNKKRLKDVKVPTLFIR